MTSITVDSNEYSAINGSLAAANIDGKTQANTTIFTNNTGRSFVVTELVIVLTSVAGLGTPPVVNIGKTAASYIDLVNGFALTSLTAANTVIKPTIVTAPVVIANGEALVFRVATAAVATTTYLMTAIARGFYL